MNFIKFTSYGQPVNASTFTVYGRKFETLFFNTREDCKTFLELNEEYGFIGKDNAGKIHVALNKSEGVKK